MIAATLALFLSANTAAAEEARPECIRAAKRFGEAAERLGIAAPPQSTAPNGGARTPAEAAQLLTGCGPEDAARLLCYARAAWLNEELLTVDLGAETATRQLDALRRLRENVVTDKNRDAAEAEL